MKLSADFFTGNRRRLLDTLKEEEMVVLCSGWPVHQTGDADYPFHIDHNFYYMAGLVEGEITLALYKDKNGETHQALFIRKPDPLKEKWVGRVLRPQEAVEQSGVEAVFYLEQWESWLLDKGVKTLYLDGSMPVHQLENRRKITKEVAALEEKDIAKTIGSFRLVKQPQEIEAIQKAIAITKIGLENILAHLKPGVWEYQVQAWFEGAAAVAGSQGPAFDTIVASGPRGPILHYVSNDQQISEKDLVLLDLGASCGQYNGDISRTYPASGRYEGLNADVYSAVLDAQKELITHYVVGAKMPEIQSLTKKLLFEGLVTRGVVPKTADIDDYYYHGVGHPLGLDVHDMGRDPGGALRPGMVMTCEPGLYLAEYGIGVRIEDDILITEDGPVNLSSAIPKEMAEIEEIMA